MACVDGPVLMAFSPRLQKFENAALFLRLGLFYSTLDPSRKQNSRKRYEANRRNLGMPAMRFSEDDKRFMMTLRQLCDFSPRILL